MSGAAAGDNFIAHLKAARTEGAQTQEQLIEQRMPTPDDLSIAHVVSAEAEMVAFFESALHDGLLVSPDSAGGNFRMAEQFSTAHGKQPILCMIGIKHNPEWWLRLCAWSQKYGRRCTDHEVEKRYKQHVKACIMAVCSMWNRAHPSIHAVFGEDGYDVYKIKFDLNAV